MTTGKWIVGSHGYRPTQRGRIFQDVYAGCHTSYCQGVDCPCHDLEKPMEQAADEMVARMRMVERGLTMEQARATLYDW